MYSTNLLLRYGSSSNASGHPAELEAAVEEWLAQPGPALLNVKVMPLELVMPPFTAVGPAYGMALYSLKAVLHGKSGEVLEMIEENLPRG